MRRTDTSEASWWARGACHRTGSPYDDASIRSESALSPFTNLRGRSFTGFAPLFHFLVKLPFLHAALGFGFDLFKNAFLIEKVVEGRAAMRTFPWLSHHTIPSSAFVLAQALPAASSAFS